MNADVCDRLPFLPRLCSTFPGFKGAGYVGLALVAVLLLGGCSNQDEVNKLRAYIAEVKKRPGPTVTPLPKVALPETFSYTASGLRDPFAPLVKSKAPSEQNTTPGSTKAISAVHPDFNRNREALEFYPLDSLRMVGTLEQHGERWGIVRSAEGKVFLMTVGNYMGQNHGRIEEITETRILLTEIVPDGPDSWKRRPAALTLSDQ